MTPMMGSVTPFLDGAVLLAAGVYQWTPLKSACLKQCRTPLGFIMTEWRDGPKGALTMGVRHGVFCLGCCWFLMGLLFVAGLMNLLWIAIVAAYILVEKIAPAGH
jgi:predicted metal-binding membrane protein